MNRFSTIIYFKILLYKFRNKFSIKISEYKLSLCNSCNRMYRNRGICHYFKIKFTSNEIRYVCESGVCGLLSGCHLLISIRNYSKALRVCRSSQTLRTTWNDISAWQLKDLSRQPTRLPTQTNPQFAPTSNRVDRTDAHVRLLCTRSRMFNRAYDASSKPIVGF